MPNKTQNKLPAEALEALRQWLVLDVPAKTYVEAERLLQERFQIGRSHVALWKLHRRWKAELAAEHEKVLIAHGMAEYLKEAHAQAQATVASQSDPSIYANAALIQIGALTMKLGESKDTDPETVNSLKDLIQTLLKGNQQSIERTKLRQKDQEIEQGEKKLKLEVEKHEWSISEKMLDAEVRRKMEAIATMDVSRKEQIAAMREALFADVAALEASGKQVLPA